GHRHQRSGRGARRCRASGGDQSSRPAHAGDRLMTNGSTREHAPTPWVAIGALALAIFVMITIEELPIGVLTLVSDDLGISSGVAGLTVTIPGVLAGVVAVLTPTLIGRLDRRLALVLALLLVFVSAAASALAPNLAVLLASRLFAGFAIGIFWALMAV